MAKVIFYEKPGCKNNTKQKQLLRSCGHSVEERDLINKSWSLEELKPFFEGVELEKRFNYTAPAIKKAEVDPLMMSEEEGLEAMTKDPYLIKRPLMIIDNEHYIIGFDKNFLSELIGLTTEDGDNETQKLMQGNIVDCPHPEESC